MPAGVFITLEGVEGSGKTTQAAILGDALRKSGHSVTVTHEPGGTRAGETIRAIFLDPAVSLDVAAELLLVLADRAQHVREKLRPALAAGEIPDASALSSRLDDKDRRLIFEILFEALPEGTWDDAESCLNFLRNLPVTEELATLQRQIEAAPPADEMKRLVVRRMELLRQLSSQRELDKNLPIQ